MSEQNPQTEQADAVEPSEVADLGENPSGNPGGTEGELEALLASGDVQEPVVRALEEARIAARTAEDKMLRAVAESQNERRRLAKDQADKIRFANERLLGELLPVLDNLELCLAHATDGESEGLRTGVEMTVTQFRQAVENTGATPVEAEVGGTFDPKLHDAVMQDDKADLPARTIAAVLQSGYSFRDRVLRPAKVAVSTGKGHSKS